MKIALKLLITFIVVVALISSGYYMFYLQVEDNDDPNIPTLLLPQDDATSVLIDTDIRWIGGDPNPDDSVAYDVYFGTTTSPSKVSDNQSSTNYSPPTLEYETTYYWQIVSWDDQGASTEGSLWSFTTQSMTIEDDDDDDVVPDGDDDDDDDVPGDDDDDVQSEKHTVFIEEATANYCSNCPAISAYLHEIHEDTTRDYDFYYVSMVYDESTKAEQRLTSDYNVYALPTAYVDGGYDVLQPAEGDPLEKSEIEASIQAATQRTVPQISIQISAEWDNSTEEIDVIVTLENKETTSYTGTLKIYLTEKVSRWYDYDGKPYAYGFLDFIINKAVTIPAGQTISESKTWDGSSLDPENLFLIAVIFNSESVVKDSNPHVSDTPKEFDAYYADATDATEIIEGGNLPPQIGFEQPKKQYLQLFGREGRHVPRIERTILVGKTTVKAYASDDSAITKVEFLIDDTVFAEDSEAPYEWEFRKMKYLKRMIRRHTFTLIAYDDEGKTSSVSMDVLTIFL